jgi:Fibronectin type III domain
MGATLNVIADRPEIPRDVRIVSCSPTVAEVAWRPGTENNDQIIEYIVYYNLTLFDGERDPPNSEIATGYREGPRTDRNQLLVRVRLVPGASYSFHVRARNSVGISDRSVMTRTQCRTPPTVPFRNPSAVCTESRQSNQLVIVWQVSISTFSL